MFKAFNPGGPHTKIYFSSQDDTGIGGNNNIPEEFIYNPSYRPGEVLKSITIKPIYALPTNAPLQSYQMIFNFPNDTRLDMPLPDNLTNKGNVTTGILVNFQVDSTDEIKIPIGLRNVTPIRIYNVSDPNLRGACVISFEIGKEGRE